MSYDYTTGLLHKIKKEEYHHLVKKITTPIIKRLEKKLYKLISYYPNDYVRYDIKKDILTSQIEALKKL